MWQKIENKEEWESNNFLQSWEWGNFQKALGRDVLRFSWDEKIFVQAIKINLPFGKLYWYVPRGPVVLDKLADTKSARSEEHTSELQSH